MSSVQLSSCAGAANILQDLRQRRRDSRTKGHPDTRPPVKRPPGQKATWQKATASRGVFSGAYLNTFENGNCKLTGIRKNIHIRNSTQTTFNYTHKQSKKCAQRWSSSVSGISSIIDKAAPAGGMFNVKCPNVTSTSCYIGTFQHSNKTNGVTKSTQSFCHGFTAISACNAQILQTPSICTGFILFSSF